MARDKLSRHIGAYVAPEKHAAFEAAVKAKGLNIQSAMEFAIDVFLANAGVVVPVASKEKRPRRGSVPEMLHLLLEGQSTILKVLREISGSGEGKHLKLEGREPHQIEDGEFAGVPANHTKLIAENPPGSRSPGPVEKDRPPKPQAPPATRPRRRKN